MNAARPAERLFEITFTNGVVKKAWAETIYSALEKLGFYNPECALAVIVTTYRERATVLV